MDADTKKTALRMIPYGIYVMTAKNGDDIAAATVNWVTQTAFDPPLLAVGVKNDSSAYETIKAAGKFALNMLGKDQQGAAFAFFKPAEVDGDTISGESFTTAKTGAPILDSAPAAVECEIREVVEMGCHHVIVGEVINAVQNTEIEGRPDHAILHMSDLGDKVFYGG